MNANITEWALKWGVSYAALKELEAMFGLGDDIPAVGNSHLEHSETYVQSLVRLEASKKGLKLWRNNVGALEDRVGRLVRYGLANDSQKLNDVLKSGDLIGWRPLLITRDLVGFKIAQFVSRECKKPGWTFTGQGRENAQLRWAQAVNADGGDAGFANKEGTL